MKKSKSKSSPKQKTSPHQIESSESSVRSVTDVAILNTLLAALGSDQPHSQSSHPTETYSDLSQWIDFQHLPAPGAPMNPPSAQLGQRFGKWKILSLGYENPSCKEPHFLLRCDCGSVKAKPQSLILSGQSKSCGCKK